MPSYRYTRDIQPDDLQEQQARPLSPKEKRQNWWHYHWKLVLAITVAVALLGFFIAEILRKDNPDLRVAIITPESLPSAITDQLADEIGGLVGDLNNDGKTFVEITVLTLSPYADEEEGTDEPAVAASGAAAGGAEAGDEAATGAYVDAYSQMAGITKLSGIMADDETMLFLVYTEYLDEYQQAFEILEPGSITAWGDIPTLANLALHIETDSGTLDAGEVMQYFSVGVRRLEGKFTSDETALANHEFAASLLAQWG